MKINKIIINNLRNHQHSEIEFGDKINLIYGLNGSGKTTILEAISIAALSKSFLPTSDQELIRYENEFYSIICQAYTEYESSYNCKIEYKIGNRKKISNTHKDTAQPKDLVGLVPIIILSPDYKNITFGGPADRRSFLDRVISQASKSYLSDLMKLRRILKQRNSLLSKFRKEEITDRSLLEPWTQQLIDVSISITSRRKRFIDDILNEYKYYYKEISNSAENVELKYEPYGIETSNLDNQVELKEKFIKLQLEKERLEFIRGTTGFGPQKDELSFVIDRGVARENASQGQHKSILIALKLAEFEFLLDKCNEKPIILLDDIFSELDQKRAKKVLEIIKDKEIQSFITSTDSQILDSLPVTYLSRYSAKSGIISQE